MRLFPVSATITAPADETATDAGFENCKFPEPFVPTADTNVPAELNFWIR